MSSESLDQQIQDEDCFDLSRIIDAENNKAFIKENTCIVCNKLARDICQCQLGCGGVIGYNCISNPQLQSCTKCKKKLEGDRSIYRNRYINKLLKQKLKLKCCNYQYGCQEVLQYSNESVQDHEQNCQYYLVKCNQSHNGCKWEGGYKKLQEEHMLECQYIKYTCKECQNQFENQYEYLQKYKGKHIQQCLNKQVSIIKQKYQQNQQYEELLNIINKQQEKIQFLNKQLKEIVNYSIILEQCEQQKRDKKILLNDFRNGILNFNSLFSLQTMLDQIESKDILKGVKINDTNLNCYQYSYEQEQCFQQVIEDIKKFAETGEKNSQYTLARLYYHGDKDINIDTTKSFELAKKAAEQESHDAYQLLGDIYYQNKGNIEQNFQKSFKCYKQAAEMGNAEATNSLGQMYDEGEFVKADEAKALKCFEKSAQLGDYGGLFNLAVYHQEGYGELIKNPKKAFQLYKQSAKKGDIEAMKRVAVLYKSGQGVCKNLQASNKWAKRAGFYKVKSQVLDQQSQSTIASTQNSLTSILSSYDSCNRLDIA